MEHIDKGELYDLSAPDSDAYSDGWMAVDYPKAVQSMGAAIAFAVVIFGWAIDKIFRRDLW